MIKHIVLFRFSQEATPSQIESAAQALRSLPREIPQLHALSFGLNLAKSSDAYSHVLIADLDDMAAVKAYQDHPAHQRVVDQLLAPIRESRLAVDVDV